MAAFIEANDVLAWVKDVSEVAFNLSDACEAAGPDFDGISRDVDKLERAFRTVKRDSKIEGSPFCLGIPQHRVEFEHVIQDCHRSFQVLDRILQRNSLFEDVSPDSTDPLLQVGQELRSHTVKLKEVHRRTKIASVEVLYDQLGTLIGDIQSGIRDPHVLGRIVNLDALSREMDRIPPNALLSSDENKPLDFPHRLQIPQSTIHEINTPTQSPDSRSPVVPAQLDEAKTVELPSEIRDSQLPPQQIDSTRRPSRPSPPPKLPSPVVSTEDRFRNYHPPTVEDCDDGDEEVLVDMSTSNSTDSHRPSGGSAKSSSQILTPPSGNGSVGTDGSDSNSPSSRRPPQKHAEFSPLKRTDTDLLRTNEDTVDIKEKIRKDKEAIQELEKQKELEQKQKNHEQQERENHEFRRRWSAKDAEDVQQEIRDLPDPRLRTFFVMPSGKIVERGGWSRRDGKSKGLSHHEQRPLPLRRSSTMDSLNSFHDPRSPRGNPSDIGTREYTTETPNPEGQRVFRHEPAVSSFAGYGPSSYGPTSNGSSGYTPTTYNSPGYEWNHRTNSFDSPSLGSPGYGSTNFNLPQYNHSHLEPFSYGSYGPYSQEPSSYSYSTSNPNIYNPSAASSYDSYDYPQHRAPFTDTTNATASDPRYVPSSTSTSTSTDNSSIQPYFSVSPHSSTSLTPIPSPTGATLDESPKPVPVAPSKADDIFNDFLDSWQQDQRSRHRHRSHRSRNAASERLDRNAYPPPLPPKDEDTGARVGRSAGTGGRLGSGWSAFRR
ncbi:hypothetical protein IWX46DRAFT_308575 [Phyllosticta citricarpa]|uniref:Uncharacterized protein n=1 Tax=Phyllosticta citricarpa TaxID=55181 RepID=A0ABR1LL62_9PEZI